MFICPTNHEIKIGEIYDDTCMVDKVTSGCGLMFWGSFSGTGKGPCLVWDKSWGNMTSESYCARVLPLISHEMQSKPHLGLMQDNAG